MFLGSHPWTGGKSNVCLGREFDPVGFVAIVVKVFVKLVFSDWISGHAGWGNFFTGNPGNGVEDELSVAINGPVAVVVSTGEAGSPASVLTNDPPEQRLFLSFREKALLGPKVIDVVKVFLGRGRPPPVGWRLGIYSTAPAARSLMERGGTRSARLDPVLAVSVPHPRSTGR